MATSLVTSNQGHLPLLQPSPVRVLADAIHQYQNAHSVENPFRSSSTQTPSSFFESLTHLSPNNAVAGPSTPSPLDDFSRTVVNSLASTSASFLVSSSPLHSSSQFPRYIPASISPSRKRKSKLLDFEPETQREWALQQGLVAAHEREAAQKAMMGGMQSTIILQGMYCDSLHGQLAAQEEAKNNSKKRGKLMGNGLPCYLSGDAFYTRVVDHEKAAADEEVAKQARKEGREQRAAVLEEWKKTEEARKKRNRELKGRYQTDLERWKEEKELVKLEKRRLAWKKPTRGKLEVPLPKPVLAEGTAGDEFDVDGDDHENASDEDEEE